MQISLHYLKTPCCPINNGLCEKIIFAKTKICFIRFYWITFKSDCDLLVCEKITKELHLLYILLVEDVMNNILLSSVNCCIRRNKLFVSTNPTDPMFVPTLNL